MPAITKHRIIIDTNLWISFLLTKDYSKIDHLFTDNGVVLLFSQELLDEFVEVAERPKFRKYFSLIDIGDLLTQMRTKAKFISVTSFITLCRDPKDNFLLALAQDGKSFTIVKVPLPDLITKKIVVKKKVSGNEFSLDVQPEYFVPSEAVKVGDTLLRVPAASYLNYLATNSVVLLPTYTAMSSSKEKEEEVRKIFEQLFPNRKLIFLDAMMQNWTGGGIHCSTQQQPKKLNH